MTCPVMEKFISDSARYLAGGSFSYQPKGGMCRQCRNVGSDCSSLDFKSMKPISKPDSERVVTVRCVGFGSASVFDVKNSDNDE